MNTNSPVFLTTSEAADMLKVSRRLLEKLRLTGGGPAYRKLGVGRSARVIYAEADLLAWVDAGLRTSTSDPGPAAKAA